jgi:hypothetical protein
MSSRSMFLPAHDMAPLDPPPTFFTESFSICCDCTKASVPDIDEDLAFEDEAETAERSAPPPPPPAAPAPPPPLVPAPPLVAAPQAALMEASSASATSFGAIASGATTASSLRDRLASTKLKKVVRCCLRVLLSTLPGIGIK